MSSAARIHPASAWHEVLGRLERGTILVLGTPATGKTSLARYFVGQLRRGLGRIALLDGDSGLPAIGAPGCLSMALTNPWIAPAASVFLGSTAPDQRRAPSVAGLAMLARRARKADARTLIVDLPGLAGSAHRELAVQAIRALEARQVIALQKGEEIEPLLDFLSDSCQIYRLPVSPSARPRSAEDRRQRQDGRLRAHFLSAEVRVLPRRQLLGRDWDISSVLTREPEIGTVLGLIDSEGFCQGLGRLQEIHEDRFEILTAVPAESLRWAQVGDFRLDEDGALASSWIAPQRPVPGPSSPDTKLDFLDG
ncbi:MAG: Clp1/GlmU family protein [Acidobacteriota bacterium]